MEEIQEDKEVETESQGQEPVEENNGGKAVPVDAPEEEGDFLDDTDLNDGVRELESIIFGEGEDVNHREVLFAIVQAAVADPDDFDADDVTSILQSYGLLAMLEDAKEFTEDLDPEADDSEDAEVAELMSSLEAGE